MSANNKKELVELAKKHDETSLHLDKLIQRYLNIDNMLMSNFDGYFKEVLEKEKDVLIQRMKLSINKLDKTIIKVKENYENRINKEIFNDYSEKKE